MTIEDSGRFVESSILLSAICTLGAKGILLFVSLGHQLGSSLIHLSRNTLAALACKYSCVNCNVAAFLDQNQEDV